MTANRFELYVFPAGSQVETGYFVNNVMRIINGSPMFKIVRGRSIYKVNLVNMTEADLLPELVDALHNCGYSYESTTGQKQEFVTIEDADVPDGRRAPVPGAKRDILHLTIDRDMELNAEDFKLISEMFSKAIVDPAGSVIVTIDGIKADVISVSEGAELRLVSAHIDQDVVYQIIEDGKETQGIVFAGARDPEIDAE